MHVNKKTPREGALEFGLVLALVLGLLGVMWQTGFWRFEERPERAAWIFGAIPLVALLALFVRPLWQKLFDLWMKLAEALAWVMTRVLLTLFYFLVLTPIALIMRLLGKRPLDLAWKDGKSTYWVDKEPVEYTVERYQKQF